MNATFDRHFTTKRLLSTANKSSYIDASSGVGHLRQMSERLEKINSIQYGQGWELFVEYDTDIVATDRVIVDGENYDVRGVREENFNSIRFKKCALVKEKT
jgi:hypothetical protein